MNRVPASWFPNRQRCSGNRALHSVHVAWHARRDTWRQMTECWSVNEKQQLEFEENYVSVNSLDGFLRNISFQVWMS